MENQSTNKFLSFLGSISKKVLLIFFAVILFGIVCVVGLIYLNSSDKISLGHDDKIDITPTQIRSIENIGEWEFLSISDEELVDTIRHGFFSNDELVRIYYGTMRLGLNLHKAKKGWIRKEGDSVTVVLPPIELLDEDFIDEARTKSFFESGNWSSADREALYDKAYKAMKKRCLNDKNISVAEDNACRQFHQLMVSMGIANVRIRTSRNK